MSLFTQHISGPIFSKKTYSELETNIQSLKRMGIFKSIWLSDKGVVTDNGIVNKWKDYSGNNNDLIVSDTTLQPAFQTTGSLNGRPYLDFTGGQSLYIPSLDLSSTQDVTVFAVLENTNNNTISVPYELSANFNSTDNGFVSVLNEFNPGRLGVIIQGPANQRSAKIIPFTQGYTRGEFYKSRATDEAQIYLNGSNASATQYPSITEGDSTNAFGNLPFFVGSRGNSNLFAYMRLYALAIVPRITTPTENTFIESVLTSIYGLPVYDADAEAFLNAANIDKSAQYGTVSGLQIWNAIDRFVRDLKGESNTHYTTTNQWAKHATIYPFVGGSSSSHRLNLINPNTYQIMWYGSPTHDTSGVDFNGINQYGDTGYELSDAPDWLAGSGMAWYELTDGGLEFDNWNMGVGNTSNGNPLYGLFARRSNDQVAYDAGNETNSARTSFNNIGSAKGLTHGVTSSTNARMLYKNGLQLTGVNNAVDNNVSLPPTNASVFLGTMNPYAGSFYHAKCKSALAGIQQDSLNSSDVLAFYNAVQALQTSLNRQV